MSKSDSDPQGVDDGTGRRRKEGYLRRQLHNLKPRRRNLRADLTSGLTGGVSAVPDAMAAAVMAGVNPVHGLYAAIVGPIFGALGTSSTYMSVTTTSAMALATGSAMSLLPESDRTGALALLVVLAGLIQLALGLMRMGFLVRFVANTVMTGFLTGVAVSIVLSQLGDLTGYHSEQTHRLLKTLDLLTHPGAIDPPTLAVGAFTIAAIVLLGRTPLRKLAMLLALILAVGLTHLLGLDSVRLVGQEFAIPSSLPLPILPDLRLIPELLLSAVAVAFIGALQGAGVSHSNPNPDGRYPSISQDFVGQGVANLAAGILRGLPVGGSFGQTALLVSSGARSRWANIVSGIVVAGAILLLAPAIEALPMPSLAALLVVAGISAVNTEQIRVIWQTGWLSAAVMAFTFSATLLLPVQQAVIVSVLLTFVLQIFHAANRVRLVELHPRPDGLVDERKPPNRLPDHAVTALYPHGSLFFAGAQVFESQLPDPADSERTVVVLVLRGRQEVGSTFIHVLDRYVRRLQAQGGKLMLVGVSERVRAQLERTGLLELIGADAVYPATPALGESLQEAFTAGKQWLAETHATQGNGNPSR